MVVNRPEILIYCQDEDPDLLREVCAGIEEEGVPYRVVHREGDPDTLSFEAASDSMLGSGIGICGTSLAMQMAHLEEGRNVFELAAPRFSQCRDLGANSARAVKKQPFKEISYEHLH